MTDVVYVILKSIGICEKVHAIDTCGKVSVVYVILGPVNQCTHQFSFAE